MASINIVVLKGNITRDAELKRVGQTNIPLCKLGLAVNIYSKPKPGEQKPEAEVCFVDVVCWGELAERIGSLRKGEGVIVNGKLKMESWQDKNTGKTINKHVIQAQTVEPIVRQAPAPQQQAPQQQNNEMPFSLGRNFTQPDNNNQGGYGGDQSRGY